MKNQPFVALQKYTHHNHGTSENGGIKKRRYITCCQFLKTQTEGRIMIEKRDRKKRETTNNHVLQKQFHLSLSISFLLVGAHRKTEVKQRDILQHLKTNSQQSEYLKIHFIRVTTMCDVTISIQTELGTKAIQDQNLLYHIISYLVAGEKASSMEWARFLDFSRFHACFCGD